MRDHSASYLLISLLTLSPIILTQVACDEEAAPLGESQVLIIEGNEQIIPEAIGWFPQSEETNGFKADRDQTRVVSGQGIPVLGAGTHQLNAVSLTLVGSERNGLNYPRDLDFNPERPGELWVINQRDDSAVIFEEAGSDKQRSLKVIDPAADHFMEEVSAISFGAPGKFATCQESGNTYNDRARPNLFMGPTLWPSDQNLFGETNPDAVNFLGFDLGSHLDMLHESPYCMGIEWAGDEAYWVFEGLTNSLALIDFRQDHGPGFDDHSDGVMMRYAKGQVLRIPGIPSHIAYDEQSGLLYIADTGNRRIGVLDVKIGGAEGTRLPVKEPGTVLVELSDSGDVISLPGTEGLLNAPSGIAIHNGLIYVTDAANGYIVALNKEGEVVDWLNTGAPGLFGLTFDEAGNIYVVHGPENLVVKISPLTRER
jgi:DNA-binding beta-propeller fold protein YncE